ncbi:lytic transglycosylase domain-containing protein [Campylobacter sp. 7477a]|uniref:lytic transglycosylase domain-containing protein n=1 Tax=Campylobacter sp. 7477a TaxID=2735741 RepID=UPI0030150E78|nr:lytic transglycosylase domain-containing protein [Campylobacter sp. 7477a]
MNLLRLFSVFALFLLCLDAKILSYEELKGKPKGFAKDYYINRLINDGNYTKKQILDLSNDVFRKSGLVQKNIDKILPPAQKEDPCNGVGVKNILDANATCQNIRTTIAFSLKLSPQTREQIAQNLAQTHPNKAEILNILNQKNPAKKFADKFLTAHFMALFNASEQDKKEELFSQKFSAEFMDKLYDEKGFSAFLNSLVLERKFDKFRQNFLKITPEKTSQNDAFFLALNAVTLNDEKSAIKFFTRAKDSFERQWQKDNATHWLYLVTRDDEFLTQLSKSKDANIYSLYARDFIKSEPLEVIVPKPNKQKISGFDVSDPFLWQETVLKAKNMTPQQLQEYAKKFYTNESLGAYAYFMQMANGWDEQYFVMPKSVELEDVNIARKSLIFALARQESLFIPAVISTSYALGTMQFMPFLANAIGKKELKIKNFDQDDMFKPDIAYRFANHHLNYLEKFLYHPLFIAYAYNGGIGFTKKLITRDDMFKEGRYEPFLSLELVPVTETRNYGKKVLSNYVIYRSLMGSSIKISTLFESLTLPDLTDKFRK